MRLRKEIFVQAIFTVRVTCNSARCVNYLKLSMCIGVCPCMCARELWYIFQVALGSYIDYRNHVSIEHSLWSVSLSPLLPRSPLVFTFLFSFYPLTLYLMFSYFLSRHSFYLRLMLKAFAGYAIILSKWLTGVTSHWERRSDWSVSADLFVTWESI